MHEDLPAVQRVLSSASIAGQIFHFLSASDVAAVSMTSKVAHEVATEYVWTSVDMRPLSFLTVCELRDEEDGETAPVVVRTPPITYLQLADYFSVSHDTAFQQ